MKNGVGGAVTLLGEKKGSIVSERKLPHQTEECTENTREGECASEGGREGLSVFNILDLCRTISKTDARISSESIWVLTGLAGRLVETCYWPSTGSPS